MSAGFTAIHATYRLLARSHGGERLVVAVPRLVHRLCRGGPAALWGNTILMLPPQNGWREIFAERSFGPIDRICAAELLGSFPIAVLLGCEEAPHPGPLPAMRGAR